MLQKDKIITSSHFHWILPYVATASTKRAPGSDLWHATAINPEEKLMPRQVREQSFSNLEKCQNSKKVDPHHHEKCLQYLLDGANHPANQIWSSENPRSSWEQPIVGSEAVALAVWALFLWSCLPPVLAQNSMQHSRGGVENFGLWPLGAKQSSPEFAAGGVWLQDGWEKNNHTSFNLHLSEGFFPAPMEGSTAISFTSKSNFTGWQPSWLLQYSTRRLQ